MLEIHDETIVKHDVMIPDRLHIFEGLLFYEMSCLDDAAMWHLFDCLTLMALTRLI